jgi:glycosyltransferase involved in cell wall biosynthesis
MRILFLSGREPGYPRNLYLLHALRQIAQVDVVYEKGAPTANLRRSLLVTAMALPYLARCHYDLIFVGFYGHLLMLPFGLLKRQPVLFDTFLSTYDTLIEDRHRFSANSPPARLTRWLDRTSCTLADRVLLDTQAQIDYFSDQFKVPRQKMDRIWVGSDERLFYPRICEKKDPIVLFVGSFVPLQGTDVILQAAALLDTKAPQIKFRMIGDGLQHFAALQFAMQQKLSNVQFAPPVSLQDLPDQIAAATICLGGHFGCSAKAARTIAGKTFHSLAMGKATIVGDNPANHELLTHDYDAWFCPMNQPVALAEAIRFLAGDPVRRARLGGNAHQTFLAQASLEKISGEVGRIVADMLPGRAMGQA